MKYIVFPVEILKIIADLFRIFISIITNVARYNMNKHKFP